MLFIEGSKIVNWVYLSPHFDDVAFSCGGLIWEQTQKGNQVSIWTICAGNPPPGNLSPFAASLHQRWDTGLEAVQLRREEDNNSNQILNSDYYHFSLPDCIYRKSPSGFHYYPSVESLFGGLDAGEDSLVRDLAQALSHLVETGMPGLTLNIVSPLGLGSHVDHQLVRKAAEALAEGQSNLHLWYYADFPYLLHEKELRKRKEAQEMEEVCFPVSSEGLDAWFRASAAHASQLSTFWKDEDGLRYALEGYLAENGGICLWKGQYFSKSRP